MVEENYDENYLEKEIVKMRVVECVSRVAATGLKYLGYATIIGAGIKLGNDNYYEGGLYVSAGTFFSLTSKLPQVLTSVARKLQEDLKEDLKKLKKSGLETKLENPSVTDSSERAN